MKKSIPNKLLIVGLGNPGEEYQNTPHNAGFLTVDQLITNYPHYAKASRGRQLLITNYPKLKSEIAETKIGKTKLILAKPQTFMNNSGIAAKALVSAYKIQPAKMLFVAHDDIDLELGKIKIVKNRGSAGHKGVEDVIKKLKTKDFYRFRVGVRPKRMPAKRAKGALNKFVASRFTSAEQTLFKKSTKLAAEAMLVAIEEGAEKAASIYNR